MSTQQLPTRMIAGVTAPYTPIISKALDFAKTNMDPIAFNHVTRSWLIGVLLIGRLPPAMRNNLDLEVYSVSTILHDLGWVASSDFRSKDKVFEVDGANVAREFILREGDSAAWDKYRIQLVWDAIALHTHPSVSAHKEPEVAISSAAIMVELFGPEFAAQQSGGALPEVSREEMNRIAEEFPRAGLKGYVKEVMCGFCREKPDVTYLSFVGGFGERFVEGYSLQGKHVVDLMMEKLDD